MVALSGGQMQRVALARSLVYEPQLLLLDEPLSNLDASCRLRLRDDLRRIIKRTGVTALYVTHDQAEAVVLGDRIGVMRDGKLLQMASRGRDLQSARRPVRRQLHRRLEPACRPGLIRSGEFGTIEAGAGHRLGAWLPAGVKTGDAVKIAVRPENVRLGINGASSPTASPHASPTSATRARRPSTNSPCRWPARGARARQQHPVPGRQRGRIVLPPELCWAYPAREDTGRE